MLDQHPLTPAGRVTGLQTDAIVIGIHHATGDPYITTVDDIDAVIIPVCRALDPQMGQRQMSALGIGLYPTGRILYQYAVYPYIGAREKMDEPGPVSFIRPLLMPGVLFLPVRVLQGSCLQHPKDILHYGTPLSVDGATTGDG